MGSMNEGKNATPVESQSTQTQTVQAAEDASTEEHQPVKDVYSSQSLHHAESEVVATSVGCSSEDPIISDVSVDNGGNDLADYGSPNSTMERQHHKLTEFDPAHTQYGVDESKYENIVKPALDVEDDISRQGDLEKIRSAPKEEEIQLQYQDANKVPPPLTSFKDANREFVTGLDEIEKLFESVEVPDELDVGADGSSMQDVLVGQGLKIIWKRAKNFSTRIKNKVKSALPLLGIRAGSDEMEEEKGRITNNEGKKKVYDEEMQHSTKRQNSKEQPKKEKSKQKDKNKQKKNTDFPLITSKKAQTLWKLAKRKWEQAMNIFDYYFNEFDDTEDGEDDAELQGLPVHYGNLQPGEKGAGIEIPDFDGKFGSEVDESFLKSRLEAMIEQNKQQSKTIKT